MTDFLNPLIGRFIGPAGPVAPSAVAGTIPDPPRGLLQVDPGTIIKGVVIGRESDGLTAIATDKGTVRVASNVSLPAGTHVTLEVRPTGDRLQVLILANDAIAQASGHPAASQAGAQPLPAQASAPAPAGSSAPPAQSAANAPPPPPPQTPPPIRIVGSTLPAIVLQPQPSLPQPSLPQATLPQQPVPAATTNPPPVQPTLPTPPQSQAPLPQTSPPQQAAVPAPIVPPQGQPPSAPAPQTSAPPPIPLSPSQQVPVPQPPAPQTPVPQAPLQQTPLPPAPLPQTLPPQTQAQQTLPPAPQAPVQQPPVLPSPTLPSPSVQSPLPQPMAAPSPVPQTSTPEPTLSPAPPTPAPQQVAPPLTQPQPQPQPAQPQQPAPPASAPPASMPPAAAAQNAVPQPARPALPQAGNPPVQPATQQPLPQPSAPQPSSPQAQAPQAQTQPAPAPQAPAPAPPPNAATTPPVPLPPAPIQQASGPVPPAPPSPPPPGSNPPAAGAHLPNAPAPVPSAPPPTNTAPPPNAPPPMPTTTTTVPPSPAGALPPGQVPPAATPTAGVPPANAPAMNVPPASVPPANIPAANAAAATAQLIAATQSQGAVTPRPVQIQLPNGQVITLAQPIPEELTAPAAQAPAAGNASMSAMPISRPPMSTPPLASALPQDVRQRILALFEESPDPSVPGRSPVATAGQSVFPQQHQAPTGAVTTGTALQPGAHLQVRVVAVQIGSQQPIEIDPAAHLAGGKDSQMVFGRVIAVTPAGHAVIHTPAGNILLQQKSSLPVGAQLALAVDTVEAPAPAPVIAGPAPIQTPQQALLSLSQGWPTLADIVAILQGGAPMSARGGAVDAALARQVLAHLPQMGPRLGAGMINAMAALRSGEIGRLMGPLFATRGLGAEREETVRRLRGEFAQLSTLAQERPEVEWRALFLPYLDDQNRVQRINLYYRRPRGGDAGDDEKNGTRFVVEADFTRLGPFQLDGLMRQQRFDLMVRSRIRLDERMRRDIEAIYEETRGLTGFAGSIAFQTVDAFPVMPLEELKQSGERA